MKLSVNTMRAAGLEARWTRTRNGAPIIVVRDPQSTLRHQRETWWMVGKAMWEAMQKRGVKAAFEMHTLLGDVFSLPA